MISLSNIGLTFRRDDEVTEVLSDFSLDIAAQRFVTILGPSGVGKSTLLRMIAGLLTPTKGSITIATDKTKQLPVAMVFQDARLMPWRTVLRNAAFGLEHGQFPSGERKRRAADALALVGLSGYESRYPHELSGGQRQRVALARALAVDPDILLMDEPFAALDAITREALQDELLRIHASTRQTVVFVTHSIDEAVFLSDDVVTISGKPGRLSGLVSINAPRPRYRGDPHLADFARQLRNDLDRHAR